MDRIDLPFVPASTSIKDALGMMSRVHRSGLVTRIAGKEMVIEEDDLLGRTGELKIEQVAPSRATGMLPPNPLEDYLGTETALDSQHAHFGILETDNEFAVVVTRHEGIAHDLRASASYFACTGVRRHVYSSRTVPGDRICPNDLAPIEQIIV